MDVNDSIPIEEYEN